MQYKLKMMALGNHPEIEITEQEFENLRKSWEVLKAALAIEEKYELVVSNFLELEKDALAVSAEYMTRRNRNYSSYFDVRSTFNRRIVNLMTSTRLYIDQIQQHVKICSVDLVDDVKTSFSSEYDEHFEYRFMEALRNYVQHRGLAVHLTQHPSKRIEDDGRSYLEYQTKIYTDKSYLEGDKAFKKAVFNEMPEKVELFYAARVYMESISKVHSSIRNSVKEIVARSRRDIENAITQYSEASNGNTIGLNAVSYEEVDGSDEIFEKVLLLLSWDDVRLELIEKNGALVNLHNRYVSGKCL